MRLAQVRQAAAYQLTKPVAQLLAKTGLTPNSLTIAGFVVNLGAAGIIALGHLPLGGFLVLLSGAFDLLDGALARIKKQQTRFGALLDSTSDRLSEAALLFGLLLLYTSNYLTLEVILIYVTFVGSVMVSYIRARAEGLGIECQVGLFTRVERVIVLALGLLLNQVLITLCLLAAVTYITAGQRLLYAWKHTRTER
ncbi:CDP-alcohol phosphatidyltransferase family protein [Chloroflexota bacterium]